MQKLVAKVGERISGNPWALEAVWMLLIASYTSLGWYIAFRLAWGAPLAHILWVGLPWLLLNFAVIIPVGNRRLAS